MTMVIKCDRCKKLIGDNEGYYHLAMTSGNVAPPPRPGVFDLCYNCWGMVGGFIVYPQNGTWKQQLENERNIIEV